MTNQHFSPDIKNRVFAAASELYEASGFTSFPSVDAVRRQARVDMNSCSALMREWRKEQKGVKSESVSVPAPVLDAGHSFIATLWDQAHKLAGESLAAAQETWTEEKEELELIRQDLATSFDAAAVEHQKQIVALEMQIKELSNELESSEDALIMCQDDLKQAVYRASVAEQTHDQQSADILSARLEVDRLSVALDQHRAAEEKHLETIEQLSKSVEELQNAVADKSSQVEKHESTILDLSSTVEKLESTIRTLEDQLTQKTEQATEAISDVSRLSALLEVSENKHVELMRLFETLNVSPAKQSAKPKDKSSKSTKAAEKTK